MIAGLIGAAPVTAMTAEDGAFYIGAGLGVGTPHGRAEADAVVPNATSIDGRRFESSDLGWSAFAGYRFNSHFELEGGYTALGKFDLGEVPNCAQTGDLEANQAYVRINGRYPVTERFGVNAHAGVTRSMFDAGTATQIIAPGTVCPAIALPPYGSPDDETGSVFGVGVDWAFNERLGLRATYGFHDTKVQEVTQGLVSLTYAF
jgi:hypothetical protein